MCKELNKVGLYNGQVYFTLQKFQLKPIKPVNDMEEDGD